MKLMHQGILFCILQLAKSQGSKKSTYQNVTLFLIFLFLILNQMKYALFFLKYNRQYYVVPNLGYWCSIRY